MWRRCSAKSENVQGKGERARGNKGNSMGEEGKVVPDTKAFRIGQREVPFSVFDVALLTGLPAMGKHITLIRGKVHPNRSTVCYRMQEVWFYEHTNLYAHADDKCVPRIASWVNLYVGCKYDAAQLISSIKDNQIVPFLEVRELERREATVKAFSETDDFNAYVDYAQERLRRTRKALRTAKEALRLEKKARATTKKELELMRLRLLLMGRGEEDSVPGGRQNEGLQLAHRVEGSADATKPRITTSERDDSDTLLTKLHTTDVPSAEDMEDREPLGERDLTFTVGSLNDLSLDPGMLHRGGYNMDGEAYAKEGNVVPMLECDIQPAGDIGEEGEMHNGGEGSKSSITKKNMEKSSAAASLSKADIAIRQSSSCSVNG
ncbi:hypothetical protein Cgig2_032202 [Carnegiea gigantea]|uniref:Uncharacterized protein n=1 Tax=Carnegiea gigantea TaxID=171969 RepID=A0A9Q1QCH0_9CARY|nr:hypothetical protein Cgig2_032202 [Carnegiea gigantea]